MSDPYDHGRGYSGHRPAQERDVVDISEYIVKIDEENKRLAARVAEMEGALEKYGSHNVSQVLCEASIKEGGKCTCGLEAALAAKGGQ